MINRIMKTESQAQKYSNSSDEIKHTTVTIYRLISLLIFVKLITLRDAA